MDKHILEHLRDVIFSVLEFSEISLALSEIIKSPIKKEFKGKKYRVRIYNLLEDYGAEITATNNKFYELMKIIIQDHCGDSACALVDQIIETIVIARAKACQVKNICYSDMVCDLQNNLRESWLTILQNLIPQADHKLYGQEMRNEGIVEHIADSIHSSMRDSLRDLVNPLNFNSDHLPNSLVSSDADLPSDTEKSVLGTAQQHPFVSIFSKQQQMYESKELQEGKIEYSIVLETEGRIPTNSSILGISDLARRFSVPGLNFIQGKESFVSLGKSLSHSNDKQEFDLRPYRFFRGSHPKVISLAVESDSSGIIGYDGLGLEYYQILDDNASVRLVSLKDSSIPLLT